MWDNIVQIILKNRIVILSIVFVLTIFFGYHAKDVKLSNELTQMLPSTDSAYIMHQEFLEIFGEDGNLMFLGISDKSITEISVFKEWIRYNDSIKSLHGVEKYIGIDNIITLSRNDSLQKLTLVPVMSNIPETQQDLDSLFKVIHSLPFYDNLLFNKENNTIISIIALEHEVINSAEREPLMKAIEKFSCEFEEKTGLDVYISGLPYIRTKISLTVREELRLFILLAMMVASLALFIFFRSFKAFVFPMIIVCIGVVWALGLISLLDFEITILTGIIPPLLIVIGVENCIFLLNKYHNEILSHGNKRRSLHQIVKRIGNATMLTNATTAVGFAAFIITGNKALVEFGIVASVNIIFTFLLTITLIPTFYSFLPVPKKKHVRHLEKKHIRDIIQRVLYVVLNHRPIVYAVFFIFLIVGIWGITKLTISGTVVDDIPTRDPVYQDLLFFEEQLNGIMPLEIMIDTKRPRGAMQLTNLEKIEELQSELKNFPELSRPLSMAEIIKFARQGFYRGNPEMYGIPNRHEMNFIMSYLPDTDLENQYLMKLADSARQITRISVQMKNIGTQDIERIKDSLRPSIDKIFNPENYDVSLTGTSLVFLKGTSYLINNLATSLMLAILVISIMIALLFSKLKMVFISLLPNLFPQILTAAMMGFFQVPIKPSTIIIFSIALGISVDNSILFLAKFRQELIINRYNIKHAVICALKESGISMVYTFVVLFFGFIMFSASSFGGTQALGYLIAFTLSIALISNLFLLPSVLLSIHKRVPQGKTFIKLNSKKPVINKKV